jgi:hypothetical protein
MNYVQVAMIEISKLFMAKICVYIFGSDLECEMQSF